MRLMLAAFLVIAPVVAHAEPAMVRSEAETRSVDCAGNDAQLEGNRNTLTFTGACRSLTVRGEANKVQIDLAPGGRIDLEGNGNRIRYSTGPGAQPPAVRVSGSNTDLAPVAMEQGAPIGVAVPPAVTLTGDDQNLDVECGGRMVSIQGNRSRYTLHGGCAGLSVHGDGNTVSAALRADAVVEIEGNGTALTYTVPDSHAAPQVTVRGNNSRATREGQPVETASLAVAPAAAPPAAPAASVTAVSVPQMMQDLGAVVVAQGTLVSFPEGALFDGATDQLRAESAVRLNELARLIAQTHPAGIKISGSAPDAALALRQARAVQAWLGNDGQVHRPLRSEGAGGAAKTEVLLLR